MFSNIIKIIMHKVMNSKGMGALARLDEHAKDAAKNNEELIMRIIRDNENTEYGKKYDFANIKSIADYQAKVPFSTFDDYAPYIDRMVKNHEKNLITAYPVIHYAETSGSVGVQKKIPVTSKSMEVYQLYAANRLYALAERHFKQKGQPGIGIGLGLNTLEIESSTMEDGTPRGSVSGSVIKRFSIVMPYFLSSPLPVIFNEGGMNMQYMKARFALEREDITYMVGSFMTCISDVLNFIKENWEMIVDDIENGTVNEDMIETDKARAAIMPYVKANPKRAAELRKIFNEGFDCPIAKKIWPGLCIVSAIGTGGFALYTDKVKQYVGDDVDIDYMVYAASEGIFGAASALNEPMYDLITDSCFFEFIPMDGSADEEHPLTIDKLEVGKEYEVVLTNQSGFYRYRIKDVIRVLGFHGTTPQITFAYRISQMVNLAAEKTTEEHLDYTIKSMSKELECPIDDYSLYIDYDVEPARYVLLIEPGKPLDPAKIPEYSALFEKCLCEANVEYKVVRADRTIGDPLVLLQQPQTHALWREFKIFKGSSPNQVKPVRVLDVPQKQKFFFELLEEGSKWEDIERNNA